MILIWPCLYIKYFESAGEIEQDKLASSFVTHYDRLRGYGRGVRALVSRVNKGEDWRDVSKSMFGGTGSYGNGGAMRIAPLGAYYADDLDKVVETIYFGN